MPLDFSDDQNLLRGEVRKFLAKESPVSAARRVIAGADRLADLFGEQLRARVLASRRKEPPWP